ncbi:flagellar hook assembly protein FlgD [Candidatus Borreliella tachyglossi]|uniref:Basal-body rod modification protein FlgD n=1 Tax=Candidatus Borreliella tachyglossi TaxID=1964448 RepID=A0A2S1LWL1_9SPIR|nr:flagellar hook assembly protein FlgD [Candidatus Borreliella tachyglossi]AWG42674.1 flagellar hook assembly protein FlgD [Candidatus Borreliella tachyglossi]
MRLNTIDSISNVVRVREVSDSQVERGIKGANLGRNDFLKLLITQLRYQDPTDPMKDKEFIAQMAQFSTLEQMTNMSKSFEKLSSALGINKDLDLLGKIIEFKHADGEVVRGKVTNIKTGVIPQIMVNGKYYVYENILSVGLEE